MPRAMETELEACPATKASVLLSEGFGKFISKELKGMLGKGLRGRLAALLIYSEDDGHTWIPDIEKGKNIIFNGKN